MNVVARAKLTFQMLTLLQKYSDRHSPVLKYMGQQMSGPDSSSG